MDIREDVSPIPMTITNNGVHEGLIINSNGNSSNVHSIGGAESKLTLRSSSLSPPQSAGTWPIVGLQCLNNGGVTAMHAKQDAVRLLGRKPAKYRECLKNHAANLGGHATDGCGEFMPGGDEGTLEALQCAACGCHRNFHRREVEGGSSSTCDCGPFSNKHIEPLFAPMSFPALPAPPGALLHHHHHHLQPPPPQMIMAFNPPPAADSDEFDGGFASPQSGKLRKRFRTKFTAEQKEQMWEFSEKLGWRIQKQDEEAVMQFCADVGVKRHVLKVWMHNNKNTLGKRFSATSGSGSINIGGSIERLTDEDDDEDTRPP